MIKKLIILQKKIGIHFKNIDLLKQSLTHKSTKSKFNYEKLEFLGDRVLGLIISKKLLELYPNEKEGVLDKKLASLVNKDKCYMVGKALSLENFVIVGSSKRKIGTAQKKIVSDCIEALIGAIYLDKDFNTVENFILEKWKVFISMSHKTEIDSKTQLQEYSLKKFKILPIYKIISNTGPRHNPIFKVAVKLKDTKFIQGSGSSKKNAEQDAAKNFLNHLNDKLAR